MSEGDKQIPAGALRPEQIPTFLEHAWPELKTLFAQEQRHIEAMKNVVEEAEVIQPLTRGVLKSIITLVDAQGYLERDDIDTCIENANSDLGDMSFAEKAAYLPSLESQLKVAFDNTLIGKNPGGDGGVGVGV